ncbi:cytochrome c oxidase assembly protein [Aureimonas psammosilenae]|uniref:cytochrome c oxidase assembly protein n=1 Tax=Aureimonas psammosilenae TaxID=2495496 RepID=UPI00126083DE|nr:cytochrome c oxidase assembly protein [Aureimonas psammosilenae]
MTTGIGQDQPYCGAAPMPDQLPGAFNLDPWLLAGLAACAAFGVARRKTWTRRQNQAYVLGLTALVLAFVSPLCALSSALFSARILHHLLLVSLAAPLLAVAFPARKTGASGAVLPLLVLFQVVALWFWHAPAPYAAALSDDLIYWTMEASLLGSAVLLWRHLLSPGTPPLKTALAHLVVIALMGLLGALITFAPVPLYAAHFLTTEPFGLSALEDQQLAGLLMWVPGMLPNLVAALVCVRRLVGNDAPATNRA